MTCKWTPDESWVKVTFALKCFKKGLEDTIDNTLLALQKTLLSDICSQLNISEAKCGKCSTPQICERKNPCPNGICDILGSQISSHHRNGTPNWTFTDATQWCTNYFEIAKCYLPLGYDKDYGRIYTSVKEIDINSLLFLAIHCRDVQSHFDADISPPNGILSKIFERNFEKNIIVDSASCSLTHEELEKYIDLMIIVLRDKKELAQDHTAQESVDILTKLKDKTFKLSDDEETEIHLQTTEIVLKETGMPPPPPSLPQDTKGDVVTRHIDIDTSKGIGVQLGSTTSTQPTDAIKIEDLTELTQLDNKKELLQTVQTVTEYYKDDSGTRHRDIDNSKDLRGLCEKLGRKSKEFVEACKRISMKILVCSRSFIDVWPMYKPADINSIVFVVFCEPKSNTSAELSISVSGFDIEYRTIGKNNNEDKEIPTERRFFSETEETDQKNLADILKKTSSDFMKEHSNLNIITASPVKSKDYALHEHTLERKPCIVFYVRLKGYIPIKEEEFPLCLGSYKTDVREGAFTLYNDPEPFAQRLKLGCSLGEDGRYRRFGGSGGTIGAFVDLEDTKVGCITSAHVLLDQAKLFKCKNSKTELLDANAASTFYQPCPSRALTTDTQPFGRLTRYVYNTGGTWDTGVEAGLITITDSTRNPAHGQFPKIAEGFNEANQLNYMSGKIVKKQDIQKTIGQFTFYKYGATTGLTKGAFRLQSGAVRTSTLMNQCELHKQIEVCSVDKKLFAMPGDSGSLVLVALNNDIKDLHAIGILTGGNGVDTFYVTPISEVLKALDLPLQLKNFNEHLPMDTDDNGHRNDSLSSEIDAMKINIKEVKTNLDKEIKTLNHTVETKVGNVETKVDELNAKMDTIIRALNKN